MKVLSIIWAAGTTIGGTESRIMLLKISEVSVIMMQSVALSDLYLHKTFT